MKPHQIEVQNLIEWANEIETVYASSTADKKRLSRTGNGSYRLYHKKLLVWEGMQPAVAVEKYNEI